MSEGYKVDGRKLVDVGRPELVEGCGVGWAACLDYARHDKRFFSLITETNHSLPPCKPCLHSKSIGTEKQNILSASYVVALTFGISKVLA